MVIPRSRSSGALSIESNDRNLIFGLCLDNTLVMAAVNVVFPWSMCPIVPTFTCGLLRSNFSFAIAFSCRLVSELFPPAFAGLQGTALPGRRLALHLRHHLFGHGT